MMLNPEDVAGPAEIGQLLRQRREAKGYTAQQVAEVAGVTDVTYLRWETAREEQGRCCDVSRAGMFLGLTPNQLFLKRQPLRDREKLSLEDRAALNALITEIAKMKALLPEGIRMMAEFAAKWNVKWGNSGARIPPGTIYEKPEPGVLTMKPPPIRSAPIRAKRKLSKNDDLRETGMAGESQAKYGDRKKKRKK